MVDIDKGKKKKSSKGKSKNDSDIDKSSPQSTSGGSVDTYTPSTDEAANYDGAKVADTSKDWANTGDNLNYDAEHGEKEKDYVARQVKECEEFYEDYVATAKSNIENIEKFTLVHHALMLSCAQNRIGVAEVLQDEFGYSENRSIEQAHKIVSEAGEQEAFNEVTKELMKAMIKE
jgi:hypothetical protein